MLIAGPRFAPMMFNEPGSGLHVSGELYTLDERALAKLDSIESIGKPESFRIQIEIEPLRRRTSDTSCICLHAGRVLQRLLDGFNQRRRAGFAFVETFIKGPDYVLYRHGRIGPQELARNSLDVGKVIAIGSGDHFVFLIAWLSASRANPSAIQAGLPGSAEDICSRRRPSTITQVKATLSGFG